MSPHNLKIWALVIAKQVEAMGMQAENEQRRSSGYAMAYSDDAFAEVSTEIERLAGSFEQ